MTAQQQDNNKGQYVLRGKGVDEVCSRFEPNTLLGPVSRILACRVRQYQDPQVDPSNWRNALELCKYDIYDSTRTHRVPSSAINHPKQHMAFGLGSCKIFLQTINKYIKKLMSRPERCPVQQPAPRSKSEVWKSMGLAIEHYLRDTTGLVVGQCIPTLPKDIEIMKNCKLPPATKPGGTSSISRENIFWTVISQFPNPQTKKQTYKDEMYGILVRTPQWGKPNTDTLQWFGIKGVMQRQDTALKELFKENSMLTLQSQETLAVLKYLTQPFTNPGSTTLISHVWPELLSEVVVEKLMKKSTDLDKRHEEQNLQEDNIEMCTYLGDADETAGGTYSPCLLPLVKYVETYDSTDAAALEAISDADVITPPKKQTLAIQSVSAPNKKSNKVTITTPTGEGVSIDDDDNIEEDNDDLLFTQRTPPTPKTTKSRKRSAATATSAPLQGKRLATTAAPTGASKMKKTEYLSDYIGSGNDNEDFDDNIIDDDELDKIIATLHTLYSISISHYIDMCCVLITSFYLSEHVLYSMSYYLHNRG